MATIYTKCHTPIEWQNDTSPALNDTNLNAEDGAIDTIDDRVVQMSSIKLEADDIGLAIKAVTYDSDEGIFTFTRWNNTTFTIDTPMEKIVTNFEYDATTQSLILTYPDGRTESIPLSAFITETEFEDSDTVGFSVTNHHVTAEIVAHSIGDEQMQSGYLYDCQQAKGDAEDAADDAEAAALASEGWSVGKQNGVDVPSTSPYYHNNARFYSEQASGQYLSALQDVALSDLEDGQGLVYDSALGKWKNGEPAIDVVDNLESTSTTDALSANMGRVLNEDIEKFVADIFFGIVSVNLGTEGIDTFITEDGDDLMAERVIA